jgi:hypothetical protein
VLLAGLQGQPVRGPPGGVDRHAHQPAGQRPPVGVAGRQEACVRATEGHGDAEALGRAHGGVGAQLAGRHQQGAGEQVGGHDGQAARGLDGLDDRPQVAHHPRRARVLQQHPERVGRGQVGGGITDRHLDAQRFGARGHHRDGLRVAFGVDEEHAAGVARRPAAQRHRLGGRGALVEHRGVGDLQAREVADHGLEGEQRLEPALADLGLVRRVRRVPGGVLEDVAQDHPGGVRAVVALAYQRGEHPIAVGQPAQVRQGVGLADGVVERQWLVVADRRGHRLVDQVVGRGQAQHGKHAVGVGRRDADVAVRERPWEGGLVGHGMLQRGWWSLALHGRSP